MFDDDDDDDDDCVDSPSSLIAAQSLRLKQELPGVQLQLRADSRGDSALALWCTDLLMKHCAFVTDA